MNTPTNNAHWLLRIALASVFVYHGILKFTNLDGFALLLPISYLKVVLVAAAELAGGLLVVLGGFRNDALSDLATSVGAALNVPVMIGAIWMVHWGRWNFVPSETHPMGGIQFQVVLILIMLYLVITGNRDLAGVGAGRRSAYPGPYPVTLTTS
jgi:putative oxidoreductase